MKKFRVCLLLLVFCCLSVPLFAQHTIEVDAEEVNRLGNYVGHHGGGIEASGDASLLSALAMPADDSNKFYITLISQTNCPPCQALKRDLARAPELQGFVNLITPKQGWAHFNEYRGDDETQMWRFKAIEVKAFPTLLLQAPRSGRYGPPATVIMQKTGYNGNAKELASQLRASLQKYVAKFQPKASELVERAERPAGFGSSAAGGFLSRVRPRPETPPFNPAPQIDPSVTPAGPLDPVVIPPSLDPDVKPVVPPAPAPVTADVIENKNPTAVIIVEGNDTAKALNAPAVKAEIEKHQRRFPNLTVQVKNYAEGRRLLPLLNLNRNELPSVVVTNDGQVDAVVKSIPIEPLPAFPWEIVMQLLNGTFTVGGAIALGAYGIALVRRWRAARGKAVMPAAGFQLFQQALQSPEVQALIDKLMTKTPPTDPPTPAVT